MDLLLTRDPEAEAVEPPDGNSLTLVFLYQAGSWTNKATFDLTNLQLFSTQKLQSVEMQMYRNSNRVCTNESIRYEREEL